MTKVRELLVRTFREFYADDGPIIAAAVAYFGIVSVFPIMLLTLAGAGHFLGSAEEAKGKLIQFVGEFLPGALDTVNDVIETLVSSQGIVSGIALIGLIWAGSQALFFLEVAMNLAWDCQPRVWWKSRLRAIGLTLLGQFLLIFYVGISALSLARSLVSRVPGMDWLSGGAFLPWLVSFLISMVVFILLNRLLPNRPVNWRAAAFGGTVTAVLFELARVGFGYYLENYANFDVLYGSIGGLVILVMWMYYGAITILVGAEMASEMEEVFLGIERSKRGKKLGRRPQPP